MTSAMASFWDNNSQRVRKSMNIYLQGVIFCPPQNKSFSVFNCPPWQKLTSSGSDLIMKLWLQASNIILRFLNTRSFHSYFRHIDWLIIQGSSTLCPPSMLSKQCCAMFSMDTVCRN